MKISSLEKAWSLLTATERTNARKVLAVSVVGAFASAAMVGSVFPFLSVLSNPSLIDEVGVLRWAYAAGAFSSTYNFLVGLGFCSILIILLSNIILVFNTWAIARYTEMRVHSISRRLLGHYLSQQYDFFLDRHTGDMSTNILSEAQQVVRQFMRPMAELVSASLTVIAVLTMLILVKPVVAVASIFTFAAIYGGILAATRHYVKLMGKKRVDANLARFRVLSEALGGIKDVKLLGREAAYLDRFSQPSVDMARSQIGVAVLSQAPRYAIQLVAFGGIIVLCLLLLDPEGLDGENVLEDLLPLLGILAFAAQRLMPELQRLYQSITQMAAGAAALDRVYVDLKCSSARLKRSVPAPLGLSRDLELEGISYSYPGSDRLSLSNITLSISAGERIGIIGPSGAGKTTFADIVLGLLTPQQGVLRVDGRQITTEKLRSWQQSVGYVPQDIFLTDASLYENIALGLSIERVDYAKAENAARIAQLHSFITDELPEGYLTRLGERGVRLSGGQRQRIGIARALYHDADLIVFDEATSALDNLTEREVMIAIEALPGDKTILMIAHRLSTVKVCDRILLLENGKVNGLGTWADLSINNSLFRTITASDRV